MSQIIKNTTKNSPRIQIKGLPLPVKVLKYACHSWVYMSQFGIQGINNVLDAFGRYI